MDEDPTPQDLPEDDLLDDADKELVSQPEQADKPASSSSAPPPRPKQPVRPAPPRPPAGDGKSKGAPPPRPPPPTATPAGGGDGQEAGKDAASANQGGEQGEEEEEEDFSDIESFGVLSTAGVDRLSRPVFVFYACNLPPRDYGLHDKMLRYMVKTMDAIVENDYSIIYFHHGLHRDTKPSLNWLRKVYFSFDRKYKKNLKALYVVHATMFVRTVMTILRPFISKKFGRKITFIHELAALDEHIHLTQLDIPEIIKKHDEKANRNKRSKASSSSASQAAHAGSKKVFGAPLEGISSMDESGALPAVIAAAVAHIRQHGMTVEGIFRRSANANTIKELKQQANQGAVIDFSEYPDIHIPAVMIKTFLRDLPEPLLTFDKYSEILAISGMDDTDAKLTRTKAIFDSLPPRNYELSRCLFKFFKDIDALNEENKMSASNLAIVIGPNLLWSQDMAANLATMGQINVFTQYAITNADAIFPSAPSANEAEKKDGDDDDDDDKKQDVPQADTAMED